ncbi:GNAT family N-acetyltransferase [Bordetella genomosp. 8]|uniref:GNAT family N-acetyltransferase n=1 Tax=Bordetella genomosp. 8 TaxID=1416806 RepID=A0A1W6YH22_9BORD|nr:GNAT family N-acetyltransferase [Bordetella genomosp. 8]ARP79813.1 GNAT family N-acetyltransferase [Bordetella genomosp. 8]
MQATPELSFRPATDADIPTLMALRQQTMTPHLQRAGAPSDDEANLARVNYRFQDALLVYDGAELVGLFKVARGAAEWKLVQVQIAPARQGQGLGGKLVRGLQAEAARAGCAITLEVLKGNPARRLYERCGFAVVGENALEHQMRWQP